MLRLRHGLTMFLVFSLLFSAIMPSAFAESLPPQAGGEAGNGETETRAGGQEKVRFAVLSDLHLGYTDWTGAGALNASYPNEQRFERALDWYKSLSGADSIDAVALTGDITDLGEESEWGSFHNIIKGRVWAPHKDVQAAAAGKDLPVLVAATGNHDAWSLIHPWGNDGSTLNDFTGFGNNEDRVINGYHFITVGSGNATDRFSQNSDDPYSTGDRWFSKGKTDTTGDVFSSEVKQWLRQRIDNAKREDPAKPIFVMIHWPIENTFLSSNEWGTNSFGTSPGNYFFKDDPQVVVFSGHIHVPNQEPRAIWQQDGGFTTVNVPSLNYVEMGNTDGAYTNPQDTAPATGSSGVTSNGGYTGGYIGRNSNATGNDSHPRGAVDGSAQGLIVEAEGSRITITNYDFDVFGGSTAGVQRTPQTWTFDAGNSSDRPYTVEQRKSQATAPVWPAQPEIHFDNISGGNLTFTFDQAIMPQNNPGNEAVHSYLVEFWDLNASDVGESKTIVINGPNDAELARAKTLQRRFKQWSDFMMPPNRQKPTYTQTVDGLHDGWNYELRIYPYSSFQAVGEPIIRRFTAGVNPDANSSTNAYALSFDGTLANSLGSPANVNLVSAVDPRSSTASVVANPQYVTGANDRQALRLGYDGNGADDAHNVNAFVDLGHAGAFNYNQDFTVAFRTKIRRASVEQGTGRWPQILSNMDFASYDNYGFSFFLQDGQIKLNAVAGSTNNRQLKVMDYSYSEDVRESNEWVHIAAVFDKKNRKLRYYANGKLMGEVTLDLSAGINTGNKTYIGQSYNSSENIFTGKQGPLNNGSDHGDWISFYLQDFVLQPGALTDGQILSLANDGELAIKTATLPESVVGRSYLEKLELVDADDTVSFSQVAGSLPAGLTLSSAGVISGTPSAAGTGSTSFTVEARSVGGKVTTKEFTLSVRTTNNAAANFFVPLNGSLRNDYALPGQAASPLVDESHWWDRNQGSYWDSNSGGVIAPWKDPSGRNKSRKHRYMFHNSALKLEDELGQFSYNRSFTLSYTASIKSGNGGLGADPTMFGNKIWQSGDPNEGFVLYAYRNPTGNCGMYLNVHPVGGSRQGSGDIRMFDLGYSWSDLNDKNDWWAMVTVVFDVENNRVTWYKNGERYGSINVDLSQGMRGKGGVITQVGRDLEPTVQGLDMDVADILLREGALSDAEVKQMYSTNFGVTINSSGNLPHATRGVEYFERLDVMSALPVTWSFENASDQRAVESFGLKLENGIIHGTPTRSGTLKFKVKALNNSWDAAYKSQTSSELILEIKPVQLDQPVLRVGGQELNQYPGTASTAVQTVFSPLEFSDNLHVVVTNPNAAKEPGSSVWYAQGGQDAALSALSFDEATKTFVITEDSILKTRVQLGANPSSGNDSAETWLAFAKKRTIRVDGSTQTGEVISGRPGTQLVSFACEVEGFAPGSYSNVSMSTFSGTASLVVNTDEATGVLTLELDAEHVSAGLQELTVTAQVTDPNWLNTGSPYTHRATTPRFMVEVQNDVVRVTGVQAPEALTGLAAGTPQSELGMPDTVLLSVDNAALGAVAAEVVWTAPQRYLDDLARQATGGKTYSFTGTVRLPEGLEQNGVMLSCALEVSFNYASPLLLADGKTQGIELPFGGGSALDIPVVSFANSVTVTLQNPNDNADDNPSDGLYYDTSQPYHSDFAGFTSERSTSLTFTGTTLLRVRAQGSSDNAAPNNSPEVWVWLVKERALLVGEQQSDLESATQAASATFAVQLAGFSAGSYPLVVEGMSNVTASLTTDGSGAGTLTLVSDSPLTSGAYSITVRATVPDPDYLYDGTNAYNAEVRSAPFTVVVSDIISEIAGLEPRTLSNGVACSAEGLALPKVLSVTAGGTTQEYAVTWTLPDATAYESDTLAASRFEVRGSISLPAYTKDRAGARALAYYDYPVATTRTVSAARLQLVSEPASLDGIANGTTLAEIENLLPKTVELMLDSLASPNVPVPVTWDLTGAEPAYDAENRDTQTFTLNGVASLPPGVEQNGVPLTTRIEVTVARIEAADKSALHALIGEAHASSRNIAVSEDEGQSLSPGTLWVAPETQAALQRALDEAIKVRGDDFASATEVEAALKDLQAALDAFNAAKREASSSNEALLQAIARAHEAQLGVYVSADGKDVVPEDSWVTEEEAEALSAFLAEAETQASSTTATQKALDAATTALERALQAFEDAKKAGVKVEEPTPDAPTPAVPDVSTPAVPPLLAPVTPTQPNPQASGSASNTPAAPTNAQPQATTPASGVASSAVTTEENSDAAEGATLPDTSTPVPLSAGAASSNTGLWAELIWVFAGLTLAVVVGVGVIVLRMRRRSK